MALPNLHGVARLTADPELKFAASGTAVCTLTLAFNSRRQNRQTGEWEDARVHFQRAKAFGQFAENIAESLTKGTEVSVSGRLETEQWTNEQGEKRSAAMLLLDSIGPELRRATARVHKAERSTAGQSGDSWASTPTSSTDEPPF
ncbi:single-strand DNA-binding protein [Saccharopolyspora antimicrobica]|uniref:Single-stranded DNA-binding protein n=1 Tax=Saccharopolyspora antimicrobica TaxID=455193 RepID=A0A1I5KM20_9PSEU|nr:single-stranded DNA-binding protein [Saccharopolyspora antimicrobica]RKT85622.1 single-strand DNA-binding protein [Saccharopolyspora antimicrobica]SFO85992.1 single-strand DNA-binding protein [Saccharopolyspora antimicrobica]